MRRNRLGQDHPVAEDRADAGPRPGRWQGPDRPYSAAPHRRVERGQAHRRGTNSPLGEVVGFKVRFQDRLQGGASVKLMTDGILLAETQSDPLLRHYDTLIIDEAHERSLNIDFLLGYLRRILPRRPDLKLIVTSATIDADRFARHFAQGDTPAPVIQVSGRVFPVEQRWRPFEESREYDLNDAIADAVDELWRDGPGDVLVFLPGEREIREAAEHLRSHHPPGVEVMPLFARLTRPSRTASSSRTARPHRAGDQCGRNLVHGTGHPLCRRCRHRARQALQLSQQGRAVAGRTHQPGGSEPARRALRAGQQWRVHPSVRRDGLHRAAALHRPRNHAFVAGRRDPANEVARLATWTTFRSWSRHLAARLPTVTSCSPNSVRWTKATNSRRSAGN